MRVCVCMRVRVRVYLDDDNNTTASSCMVGLAGAPTRGGWAASPHLTDQRMVAPGQRKMVERRDARECYSKITNALRGFGGRRWGHSQTDRPDTYTHARGHRRHTLARTHSRNTHTHAHANIRWQRNAKNCLSAAILSHSLFLLLAAMRVCVRNCVCAFSRPYTLLLVVCVRSRVCVRARGVGG